MSWGERSCSKLGICNYNPTFSTCNVDCEGYFPNGMKSESVSTKDVLNEKENVCHKLSRKERRKLNRKKKK